MIMIGRTRERKDLNRLYESGRAELVAVYGRYRVGKTYLIDETFSDRITFRHAGLTPNNNEGNGFLKKQLNHFYNYLKLYDSELCYKPDNWLDAFFLIGKIPAEN